MIVYADEAMVVADKPAGLLSVPGRGPDKQDCLVARVRDTYPDALTVHRLDMATSGLIVLGRGPNAQRALSQAFENRRTEKRYIAVVHGHTPDEGEVNLPLITDWPNRPRQKVDHDIGKPSLTRYRIISRDDTTSRVELEPVTGRSHQLRVHMLAIGHPIVGDEFYCPDIPAPRMLLHAERLAVPHPLTGEMVRFYSPAAF
ncbi:RNA pseudouridylate synthase family protein [Asticcacaulis biprosthecium C19]|uniref:Dual-specificity RNA pseudouridine synthase RluA n=1 Tax=Asticcacaulis biprosthecium C19 TaxID=715226 RepID=F4QSB6_9CAUL|nr:pseudouridine synthase [Asticcacaulis biprosthecium]EGF89636.1 RNA pseudouridylate synthase family protein [Asticcacaulis biprosthecium C19]